MDSISLNATGIPSLLDTSNVSSTTILLNLALVGLGAAVLKRIVSKRSVPLPPGPKGWPVIGSLFLMVQSANIKRWHAYAQWSQQWGSMVYMTVLGQGMLIINSRQLALEYLEKRSTVTSDRPQLFVATQLGINRFITLDKDGPRFRDQRRMMAGFMGSWAVLERFHPAFERETSTLLKTLLDEPKDFATHVHRLVGAVILPFVYGYHPNFNGEDPVMESTERGVEVFLDATKFGSFIVDSFPTLRFIPSWLPGGGWKRMLAPWQAAIDNMLDVPYVFTQKKMSEGMAEPCFVTSQIEKEGGKKLNPEREEAIKLTANAIWGGASDTSPAALKTFFLMMMLHPEIQRKAQAEIDAAIGPDGGLPNMQTRAKLPYIEAIFKEVLRMYPVTPLGFPHAAREDDVLDGYLVPKSTVIMVNVWEILHDPKYYSDPFAFKPERFLTTPTHESELDPSDVIFGFGRRICPGNKVANLLSFLAISKILAVFDITKPVDASGKPIEPVIDYNDGTISHPAPFECAIKPRSAKAVELIHEAAAAAAEA
ncbi:cytochrome P450 [Stereum hirsutum FP-91666 SS1]|uniref:cytochrome P450 n=1 Tax=Stereum hirsutum (strain FP-91666) TaxID=721885 RepID=UPI000440C331|nr:cytochrome P450 [Stereum hirsutum FP-91666 SS1]EIM91243.1 cytochrome P450 [Stereum hirsutum FP-91666 SS1]